MNQKTSLIIIISILLVQILSSVHMANHGVEKHKHAGIDCEISLANHKIKSGNIENPIKFEIANLAFLTADLIKNPFIKTNSSKSYLQRAPPTFS